MLMTSMVCQRGALICNSTVHLKNRSRTQRSQCHPPPQRSGGIPSEWTDVCGFVKPPKSQSGWLIRKYGASEIIGRYLGLSSEDLTCHHEVWIHLSHVSAPLVERSREPRHRKRDLSRQPVKKRQELYLVREDVTVRAISPQEDTVGDKLRNKVSLVMRSVEHFFGSCGACGQLALGGSHVSIRGMR